MMGYLIGALLGQLLFFTLIAPNTFELSTLCFNMGITLLVLALLELGAMKWRNRVKG